MAKICKFPKELVIMEDDNNFIIDLDKMRKAYKPDNTNNFQYISEQDYISRQLNERLHGNPTTLFDGFMKPNYAAISIVCEEKDFFYYSTVQELIDTLSKNGDHIVPFKEWIKFGLNS